MKCSDSFIYISTILLSTIIILMPTLVRSAFNEDEIDVPLNSAQKEALNKVTNKQS